MSATTASPIRIQSNPLTPPGATKTYISVVHGASRNPRNGTQNESKVALNRTESKIHQSAIAERGPKNNRTTKMHIATILPTLRVVRTRDRPRTAGPPTAVWWTGAVSVLSCVGDLL